MTPQQHAFARTDRSRLGVWWWTTDHLLLGAVAILIVIGVMLWLQSLFGHYGGDMMFRLYAIGFTLFAAQDALRQSWLHFVVDGTFAAFYAWQWYRKDRRKVRDVLGAKSRALRDALVRKAREVAKPRPVLRPVPGGAR